MNGPAWKLEARRQYLESLPEKASALRMLLESLAREPWDPTHRSSLFQAFHRIEGSAGSYECDSLGQIAAACTAVLSNGKETTPQTVELLHRAVDEFGRAVAILTASAPANQSFVADRMTSRVLVVDDELEAQTTLRTLLEREGFSVQFASTCAEAERILELELPAAMIIDIRLPDGSGLDLLNSLRERTTTRIPAIVISAVSDFSTKLDAVRRGSDAYFEKPFDWEEVIGRLRVLIERPVDSPEKRILLVEDDLVQATFVQGVLEESRYSVRIVDDAEGIDQILAGFQPDLILLDVHLPSGSGIDIARYLRQRATHATLPIIFLTAARDPIAEIDAIRAGGDDFLRKPVSPDLLLTSVAARLARAAQLKSMLDHDSLTGLLTHAAIVERIALATSLKKRDARTELSLVLLDVDHFKSVNDTHGHLTGDRVLAALGAFLRHRLRDVDVVGRYGGEEFALILATSGEEAVDVVRKLLETFSGTTHTNDEGKPFTVRFTAGVAALTEGMSAEEWKRYADRALLSGKMAGRCRVVLADPAFSPAIDEDVLVPLRALGQRAGVPILAELTELFFQTLPHRLATLEDSANSGDATRLENAAHALRSAAGNLGARKLATLCGELEHSARGDTAHSLPIVTDIISEASRVAKALRAVSESADGPDPSRPNSR